MICNKRFNGVSVGVGCECGAHWRGHGRLVDGPRLNAESATRARALQPVFVLRSPLRGVTTRFDCQDNIVYSK